MKKISVILIMALMVSMVETGCGNSKNKETAPDSTAVQSSEEPSITEQTSTKQEPVERESEDDVYSVGKYLEEKGVASGEISQASAEMIGAKEGIKYLHSGIEIYEYDMSSDAYKTLKQDGKIEVQGFEGYFVTVNAVNGKFVLIISNEKENVDAVNAFGEYKVQ